MKKMLLGLALLTFLFSCGQKETADLILTNARVYTVHEKQPRAEAVAIRGDRIMAVGSAEEIAALRGDSTTVLDLGGRFLMPGFIEGHGHFSGLGNSLMNLNFLKSRNWDEIVAMVAEKAKTAKPGEWITGRGWHQEKWDKIPERNVLGYPYHDELSAVSPDNPVILRHASGHGLFANKAAMDAAGVSAETPDPAGGEIVRDAAGNAIGMFEETAMGVINQAYEAYLATLSEDEKLARWHRGIELAEAECLRKGITSFQDAGASFEEIERYRQLAESGKLDLRLWTMIRRPYAEMKDKLDGFPILNAGNHFFTCRAIKAAVDGALGSFGAWMLAPYNDKPNFTGQNTTPVSELEQIAGLCLSHDLQFCVHAIGDRANREVLDIYEKTFATAPEKTDLRWRIEHAQHLDTADIPRFKKLGVIASMQAIHCTSDSPFVIKRLGEDRARYGAYAWRSLLDAGAVVTNGTDAPVEDVDPIPSFYASVTRKRLDNPTPFFPEQKMTREEGLYAYTLANAFAAFEEDEKGSIEPGKLADLVVLSHDLSQCSEDEIPETKVWMTIVGGQIKFERAEK
ncbi:MAG: amidohydrolase [Bacteroidetes bacterium]|nr:MAG: amidohydrolase [Bacteroidota bacterium]